MSHPSFPTQNARRRTRRPRTTVQHRSRKSELFGEHIQVSQINSVGMSWWFHGLCPNQHLKNDTLACIPRNTRPHAHTHDRPPRYGSSWCASTTFGFLGLRWWHLSETSPGDVALAGEPLPNMWGVGSWVCHIRDCVHMIQLTLAVMPVDFHKTDVYFDHSLYIHNITYLTNISSCRLSKVLDVR